MVNPVYLIKYIILSIIISVLCIAKIEAGELLSVSATQIQPVKPAAYIFNFQFDSPVTATSQIEIGFSEKFTLLQNIIASSKDLSGGLEARVEKQKLVLKRVKSSETVPAGETLEIRTASIVNPEDMDKPHEFNILLINGNTITDSISANVNIELFTNQKL